MESIRETQAALEQTKQNKNATLAQLRALQSKLAERQKLIANINAEINDINQSIRSSSQEITGLKQNLEVLKVRYAQSVRFAYKNRSSYNMVAFLFSADDFNEAVRRLKYLKKYRDYRKEQAEQIRVTQAKIEKKLGILNTEKSKKDVLRTAEEQQKFVIQKETSEKDQVVRALKGREKELSREIEKNRKAARQVDAAIQKVIQQEIALARKKAEEEEKRRREEEQRKALAAANSNTGGISVNTGSGLRPANGEVGSAGSAPRSGSSSRSGGTGNVVASSSAPSRSVPKSTASFINNMTPEATALSNGFENNRGRLPWPVEKGFISQGFGTYKHPIEEKVTLENYGIDITTNPGSSIRSVFDGVVTNVFFVAGRNWNVIVSHGAYFTIYSGLVNVGVKKDQRVSTKTPIGTIGPNEEGNTVLNFQIWKVGKNNATSKVDPAQWIAR